MTMYILSKSLSQLDSNSLVIKTTPRVRTMAHPLPPADQGFIGREGQVHQLNNQLVWSLAVTKEPWLQY